MVHNSPGQNEPLNQKAPYNMELSAELLFSSQKFKPFIIR